jgi:trehalose 6-phosphate synthase/phosphatase
VGILRAENGCFVRPRPDRGGSAPWINMVANFNLTWKNSCLEILQYVSRLCDRIWLEVDWSFMQFTERTPGSFIEEREASIVWRFWTGSLIDCSDLRWARRQAAEAQNHVFDR